MTQRILLLAGKKGTGKDTLAEFLKPEFERGSFADPLYLEVQEAYNLEDQELLRNRETKEVPVENLAIHYCNDLEFINTALALDIDITAPQSPRRILQLWGTEYRQVKDGQLYWVEKLVDFVKANPYFDYCIPDLRFPHEYTSLLEYSLEGDVELIVARIERAIDEDAGSGHISEKALDDFDIFDFVIYNEEGNPQSMVDQLRQRV